MPQACTTNKRLPKRPAFSIHPTDHSKFANRLGGISSTGRNRPGKGTIPELVAIIILLSYDECLLRGIGLTGFLKEMALRDAFLPESIIEWYRGQGDGAALPKDVSNRLLERFAGAATMLSFKHAVRAIMGALGIVELSLKRAIYKAYDEAAARFAKRSLATAPVDRKMIGGDIEWVSPSGRHGHRRPSAPRKRKPKAGK